MTTTTHTLSTIVADLKAVSARMKEIAPKGLCGDFASDELADEYDALRKRAADLLAARDAAYLAATDV